MLVDLLAVELEHDWAVGEELLLCSSSRSVGCGLGGSDPPKSTSSSKLPVGSGGGACTSIVAKFSTLRDLGSLIEGPLLLRGFPRVNRSCSLLRRCNEETKDSSGFKCILWFFRG